MLSYVGSTDYYENADRSCWICDEKKDSMCVWLGLIEFIGKLVPLLCLSRSVLKVRKPNAWKEIWKISLNIFIWTEHMDNMCISYTNLGQC